MTEINGRQNSYFKKTLITNIVIIVIMAIVEVLSQLAFIKYNLDIAENYQPNMMYYYLSMVLGYLVFGALLALLDFRSKQACMFLALITIIPAAAFIASPSFFLGEFFFKYGLGIQNKFLLLSGLFFVKPIIDSVRDFTNKSNEPRTFGDRNRKWDTKDFDY